MSYQADITIIGAGVIGLAVASEVSREGRQVYLLEKNDRFGLEQSSRNSEVIHAGIYYDRDSLKARLCREGNARLYELGEKTRIPYVKCGKIIIATSDIEAGEMEVLYARGRDNGAPLAMLSQSELARLEPNVVGRAAFLSPDTGIIDSHALMRYFLEKAASQGAHVAYRTTVNAIEAVSGGYKVSEADSSGGFSFTTRVLINCAGLYSDRVAAMAGIDDPSYKLHWCKGEYYSVTGGKNRLIRRLIYPVPMSISVGAHVCLDVDWRLRLGPLFYYVNEIDYRVDSSRKQSLLESSMMTALPFITPDDLQPEGSGIMAMLQGEGEGFRDFVIRHEADRGLPAFINLVGIESPGLTASPAIARYVSQLVDEIEAS